MLSIAGCAVHSGLCWHPLRAVGRAIGGIGLFPRHTHAYVPVPATLIGRCRQLSWRARAADAAVAARVLWVQFSDEQYAAVQCQLATLEQRVWDVASLTAGRDKRDSCAADGSHPADGTSSTLSVVSSSGDHVSAVDHSAGKISQSVLAQNDVVFYPRLCQIEEK